MGRKKSKIWEFRGLRKLQKCRDARLMRYSKLVHHKCNICNFDFPCPNNSHGFCKCLLIITIDRIHRTINRYYFCSKECISQFKLTPNEIIYNY